MSSLSDQIIVFGQKLFFKTFPLNFDKIKKVFRGLIKTLCKIYNIHYIILTFFHLPIFKWPDLPALLIFLMN